MRTPPGSGIPGALVLAAACLTLSACSNADPVGPGTEVDRTFEFESGLEGWQGVAIDTLNPVVSWDVRHTTEVAARGEGAAELHLDNVNDAAKVWLERAFELTPGAAYDVALSYAFGTSDGGDVNLFTILVGVHDAPPRTQQDLQFRGDTGHGGPPGNEVVWLEKSHSERIVVPSNGIVHVSVGVWGTWEASRTYFVDDLTVRMVPAPL